jgi:hypothetical protein
MSPGQGYSLRKSNDPYKSFVVHTTNGAPNSRSLAELSFLVKSPNVSAHYLVGKDGTIYQILAPENYVAWHAGEVSKDAYSNFSSIGVEVHFTPKEISWNGFMYAGLTRLARVYSNLEMVTHRFIARPAGRKIDPSGFTDAQFKQWSSNLNKEYRLAKLTVNCNVRSRAEFGNNIIGVYPKGSVVVVDKNPTEGASYNNNNLWYNANWAGYIHASLIELGETV